MVFKSFINKVKYGKPIIVVSGLPRSGTSMVMKMLEAGGVQIVSDGVRRSDNDNPKGYYEFEQVKQLDKDKDKSWLRDVRGRAIKIISYFLKHLPPDNNYKVIFIIRNLQEICDSQNKMLANRGEPVDPSSDPKMIFLFKQHVEKIENLLIDKPHFDPFFINHRDILTSPLEYVHKINQFISNDLDEVKMASVIDPNLYRNRQ